MKAFGKKSKEKIDVLNWMEMLQVSLFKKILMKNEIKLKNDSQTFSI